MISSHLISTFSTLFKYPLEIVPSVLITNSITVTFMFHICFSSLVSFKYSSFIISIIVIIIIIIIIETYHKESHIIAEKLFV